MLKHNLPADRDSELFKLFKDAESFKYWKVLDLILFWVESYLGNRFCFLDDDIGHWARTARDYFLFHSRKNWAKILVFRALDWSSIVCGYLKLKKQYR